jgi:hypothetical protein
VKSPRDYPGRFRLCGAGMTLGCAGVSLCDAGAGEHGTGHPGASQGPAAPAAPAASAPRHPAGTNGQYPLDMVAPPVYSGATTSREGDSNEQERP